MYRTVYLKRGKDESLRRFHPWVFSGAIARIDEGIGEGDVVRVVDSKGEFIAVGHYQEGTITVRVLAFDDVEIDSDFYCAYPLRSRCEGASDWPAVRAEIPIDSYTARAICCPDSSSISTIIPP